MSFAEKFGLCVSVILCVILFSCRVSPEGRRAGYVNSFVNVGCILYPSPWAKLF